MRRSLLKTIAAATVTSTIMLLSSVAAMAYDETLTFSKTGEKAWENGTHIKAVHNSGGTADKGAKFDSALDKKKISNSYDVTGKTNTPYYIGITAESGDTVSIVQTDNNVNLKMIRIDGLDLANKDKDLYVSDATAFDTQTTKNAETNVVTFSQIEEAGNYAIYNTYDSTVYIKSVTLKSGELATKYTVSGKIKGDDYGEATISINNKELSIDDEKNYSIELVDGKTYPVTISDPLCTVSPDEITVNGENVTQDITVKKTPTTKVTISPDPLLGITSDIKFINSTDNTLVYTATKNGDAFEVILPQGVTYKISVLDDEGYKTSAYKINETTLTLASETTKELDLTGTKITKWDKTDAGTTMPNNVTIEKKTAVYKGITVNATASYNVGGNTRNGKFASSNGQANSKTIFTVPLDNANQEVVVNINESNSHGIGCTIEYTAAPAAVITIDDPVDSYYSAYIDSIEIVDKPVEITKATATTNVAVVSYNGKYYAVAVVSKADAETKDTLKLAYTKGSKTSSTVYKNITIDKNYDATAFLDSATADDYLYAVEISNASGNGIVDKIQTITVSLE
ncbi:MAG: hypothetical protein IJ583_11805 [Firmicutes bacterium]|nr:hypothetical protein [Bacillota bacterium]